MSETPKDILRDEATDEYFAGRHNPLEHPTNTPRIYVASLSDYNAGRLHGEWIDANQDAEAINAAIQDMLQRSPSNSENDCGLDPCVCAKAEEFAIHDYEGLCDIRLSEYGSIELVSQLAQLVVKYGDAFAAFYDNDPTDNDQLGVDGWSEMFEESYQGEFPSLAIYAEELAEDTTDAPLGGWSCWPWSSINWDHAGEELRLSGDIWTSKTPNGVYVFRSN